MKYKELTPILMVEDVNETVDYYASLLGFQFAKAVVSGTTELVFRREEGQRYDYAMMKRDGVEIMFQAQKSISADIPALEGLAVMASLLLYIKVTDARQLYDAISDKAIVIKPLTTTFYGRDEFFIKDCNGYILGFASSVPS
ncbi:MAG: VOC family protein [Deltaproteobacteria bacterium]|nr:VOC family protein [Deltaproteobacteria bacterium]